PRETVDCVRGSGRGRDSLKPQLLPSGVLKASAAIAVDDLEARNPTEPCGAIRDFPRVIAMHRDQRRRERLRRQVRSQLRAPDTAANEPQHRAAVARKK